MVAVGRCQKNGHVRRYARIRKATIRECRENTPVRWLRCRVEYFRETVVGEVLRIARGEASDAMVA